MKNILVIGSINVDLVIHTPRLPQIGETIRGGEFQTVPGGKGANQATACGLLGGSVRMLGCVGRDLYGQMSRQALERSGVDVSLLTGQDGPTGVAVITVCQGDNCIVLDAGANGALTPTLLEETAARQEIFSWADLVLLQLEIPMETVVLAARLAKRAGATVLLNPAPMQPFPDELWGLVDILSPNQVEASQLLGRPGEIGPEEAPEALAQLRGRGIPYPHITLGGEGCAYFDGEQYRRREAYPVTPVDTTAAGDSFMGGLAAALCRGETLSQAVDYATAVSAISVTRPGATASIPTAREVEEFLAAQK